MAVVVTVDALTKLFKLFSVFILFTKVYEIHSHIVFHLLGQLHQLLGIVLYQAAHKHNHPLALDLVLAMLQGQRSHLDARGNVRGALNLCLVQSRQNLAEIRRQRRQHFGPAAAHAHQPDRVLGIGLRLDVENHGHRVHLRLEPGGCIVAIPHVLGIVDTGGVKRLASGRQIKRQNATYTIIVASKTIVPN